MKARAAGLVREIHLLALRYRWTEADVLALRLPRRRAYLALLDEAANAALLSDLDGERG